MLKGLKVKKHHDNQKSSDEPKLQKKWKKSDPSATSQGKKGQKVEKEPETFEEKIAFQENKLISLCESTWDSFLEGNNAKAIKGCQDLYMQQKGYFDKVFKGEKYSSKQFALFEEEEEIMMNQQRSELNLPSKNSLNFDSKDIDSKIKIDKIKNLRKYNYDSTAMEFFKKYNNSIFNDEDLANNEYDDTVIRAVEEDGEDKKKKSKKDQKYEERKHKREEKYEQRQGKQTEKILSSCKYCLANNETWQEQIVSLGTSTILILPKYQRYSKIHHVQILPLDHYSCITELDEEVYAEVRNFMKCLVAAFDKQDKDVIFFENAVKLSNMPHCIIECVALPRSVTAKSELYFRKGIDEMESEWSVHKKRIDISREKGGITKQIPKNFPYFYVDFNMSFGYAHVIENEQAFSKNFAHEIFATILQLDKPKVIHPDKATKNEVFNKKILFQKVFEEFDWTKML